VYLLLPLALSESGGNKGVRKSGKLFHLTTPLAADATYILDSTEIQGLGLIIYKSIAGESSIRKTKGRYYCVYNVWQKISRISAN
jgi:hypothetical protein